MPFPKGKSGNPQGMKPGQFSLLAILKRKLQETPEGEKDSNAALAIEQYVKELKKGNKDLLKDAFDRIEGKPKSSSEELGSENNPIHTVHKVLWE